MIYISHHGEMGIPLAWLLNARRLDYFVAASNGKGYIQEYESHEDDVLLIDMDIEHYADVIDKFVGKVILYPHGAAPNLTWDGVYQPHPKVSVNLVTGEGHKEVMRRYGYSKPVEVIGWYLCEIKKWKPRKGKNVLFCPIHPIIGGTFMYEEDTRENVRVFRELLSMDVELAVRYRHSLEVNGLHKEDGVYYYNARFFDDLDAYDLVVANGTLAYVAIAKGIPTVMLKQETCTRMPGDAVDNRVVVKSLDKYWDYLKYPYDTQDLRESISLASNVEPVEWKNKFIGKQMEGEKFRDIIKDGY